MLRDTGLFKVTRAQMFAQIMSFPSLTVGLGVDGGILLTANDPIIDWIISLLTALNDFVWLEHHVPFIAWLNPKFKRCVGDSENKRKRK